MRIAVALGALLLLAACGRVGDIRPPGPPEQVTWPRSYPSR
jgi:predicted small lipoprotein YifL